MEEIKAGEAAVEGGTAATGDGQLPTVTSSTALGPKLTTSTVKVTSPTSGSTAHLPKAAGSTSILSYDDVTKQRSLTSLRRKKATSATTLKIQEKLSEPLGESRQYIHEDFVTQINTLMLSPKAKVIHTKPKSRVVVVFMPTYRLEPILPFGSDHAEKLMERVLENIVPMKYDEAVIPLVVQALSKSIINVVKLPSCNSDRYKLACQVRIIEKKFQGYAEKLTALWAHDFDRIVTAQVENHWMIATAVLSACYFD